jgi:non-specific serine/threonine protein kinase/serine/threonine-protein kinase
VLLERFEDAWQRGERPALSEYLPAEEPCRRAVLVELIHIDLERRLKAGEPRRLESYLADFPELAADTPALLQLLRWEYTLRRRAEPGLTPAEFVNRFPHLAAELAACLRDAAPAEPGPDTFVIDPGGTPRPVGGPEEVGPPSQSGPRYQGLQLHARGGLGEVYRAQDTVLHRAVALKRIQARHQGHADSRRRFLREAEVTGRLEHPGIVPVYDLQHDADGQPCYVMRFVEGHTLEEAIARYHAAPSRLAFRQLLQQLVAACNAVAYAHSRGVLHRDLKPANILLGPFGETLVVDWGLAKIRGTTAATRTDAAATPTTAEEPAGGGTALGQALGTPPYMSPEQAAGRPDLLGPASDIYSLGATLYALLTGRPPFAGGSVAEVLHKVGRGDFLPPRQLRPDTPRALEAICLKAMAREPAARYATALEVAADLERWLADEPVHAYREPLGARGRRWARKHPSLVAGLAATVLVGLLGLTLSAVILGKKNHELGLARQAEASRAEAEARANEQAQKRLTQVVKGNEILASIFHDMSPAAEEKEGKPWRVLVGERLGEAAEQLEGDAVGDPETVAQLQDLLGNSLLQLGHLERAEVLLTSARQTRAQLLGPDHRDTLRSMNNLAGLYLECGRYEQAEPLFQHVIEARRRQLGPDAPDTLKCMHNLAGLYWKQGRYGEEEALLKQVVEGFRRSLGAKDRHTLASLNSLAALYQARGRNDEAEPRFQQVLDGYRQTLGAEHAYTLTAMNNLAGLYQARGRYGEAEPLYEKVLEARRGDLGPDHPTTLTSLNNLAILYQKRRRYEEAERLFSQALEGRRRRRGSDHPETLQSMTNLAALYLECRRYDQAEPLLQQALAAQRRNPGPDHPDTLTTMTNLGVLYWSRKQLHRSIPLFEEALALWSKKEGNDHPETLRTLANLGVNYGDAGRLDDGIRCLEQALADARKRPGPLPAVLAWIPGALAEAYDRANRFDRAEALYRDFVKQASRQLGADDPRTAGALAQLGWNLLRQGKHVEAEKTLRDCLAIRAKKESQAWTTFNTQSLLGEALLGQKRYADAEAPLRAGYEGLKQREAKIPPPGKVRLTEALRRLVRLYDAWGKPDDAARWRKELDAARASDRPPQAPKP